jgi:NAD(P)-dependent dehydrogenase (short-subunit alcohol dehydrogenase family)
MTGPFDLSDKVIIVTGASSGLGEQFARVLAEAGATVALAARRVDRIGALAESLPGAAAIGCDVTQDEDCERLVDEVITRFGRLDVLVNNAGISNVTPALREDPADFRSVIAVNLVAPFVLARAAAVQMSKSGGGAIITVASIFGLRAAGTMPQAAYAASKGGLVNLTRELAAQWARYSIRVNALAPGFFRSELTEGLWEHERLREWMDSRTPMRREGRSGELDGALLFLAGPGSSYVTGQTIAVDGGWTAV